jgi:hypothetical protein
MSYSIPLDRKKKGTIRFVCLFVFFFFFFFCFSFILFIDNSLHSFDIQKTEVYEQISVQIYNCSLIRHGS